MRNGKQLVREENTGQVTQLREKERGIDGNGCHTKIGGAAVKKSEERAETMGPRLGEPQANCFSPVFRF